MRIYIISKYLKKFIFLLLFFLFFSTITFSIFSPLYSAHEVIISYGFHPFDIVAKNPSLWKLLKTLYIFCFTFSIFVFGHFLYTRILLKFSFFESKMLPKEIPLPEKNSLHLLIGKTSSNDSFYLPENGLYQNFLITGTIGSGKTSSAMYPFTKQLMKFNYEHPENKIGMLILDVKGNFYHQVDEYAQQYKLKDDLIIIELNNHIYYNPLHKPDLKPQVLANRLKNILLLFSENNSESYWLDKAEEILTECIKLCRLYNNNYFNFL